MPAPPRIKYTQEKEWLCMSEKEMTKADNRQRYIELGYNIAYYRKHAGLTQEQLAEKAGISRPHMGAIEAPKLCRPISLELLFNLADALGVEPHKLLEFREGK